MHYYITEDWKKDHCSYQVAAKPVKKIKVSHEMESSQKNIWFYFLFFAKVHLNQAVKVKLLDVWFYAFDDKSSQFKKLMKVSQILLKCPM